MISKQATTKRVYSHGEETESRKKSKPSLDIIDWKDEIHYRSPASPAGAQLRSDINDRKPAEVFRTDFITAMKVTDNANFAADKTYELTDPWRQEWEKGVQVPVNPDALPKTSLRKKDIQQHGKRYTAFSLPKGRIAHENPELVHSNETTAACLYDLDDVDVEWLRTARSVVKRGSNIDESTMEKAIIYFERKCFENMAHAVATEKGLSIEYDDTTTCDVCLSPDTEDSNEIIFCDACNMCVHQACYGVQDIPTGTWLCRPCSRGVLSPPCVICPNKGGAMKRVKNSFEWIHVICAWWVPEVKIEDTENVEKMTVDKIPASRKNLCCSLCREKVGACIQCSVKRCVVAYHVTCAMKEGLEMKTVMMHDKDDVLHISYCKRHCIPQPPDNVKQRAGEEVENKRLKELQKLQDKFYTLVDLRSSARELRLGKDITQKLLSYWVLKRQANDGRPLVPLSTEQQEKLSGKQGIYLIQEQINVEMERYGLLRQDLERLRNLCYLIIRRERCKKEVHKASQEVFFKQEMILSNEGKSMSDAEFKKMTTGNELTRFTKFSHYAPDGPPYADHVESSTDEEEAMQIDEPCEGASTFLNNASANLATMEIPNTDTSAGIVTSDSHSCGGSGAEVVEPLDPAEPNTVTDSREEDPNARPPVDLVSEEQTTDAKAETDSAFQTKSNEEYVDIQQVSFARVMDETETNAKDSLDVDVRTEVDTAERTLSQLNASSPSRKARRRWESPDRPERVLRSGRRSVMCDGEGKSAAVNNATGIQRESRKVAEHHLDPVVDELLGESIEDNCKCTPPRPVVGDLKPFERDDSHRNDVCKKEHDSIDSYQMATERSSPCHQNVLSSEIRHDLDSKEGFGDACDADRMGDGYTCNGDIKHDRASSFSDHDSNAANRNLVNRSVSSRDKLHHFTDNDPLKMPLQNNKVSPHRSEEPSSYRNEYQREESNCVFKKDKRGSPISTMFDVISDSNEPKRSLENGAGQLGTILRNNIKCSDENDIEDKPFRSLRCNDLLGTKKTTDRIFRLNEAHQLNSIDGIDRLKRSQIEKGDLEHMQQLRSKLTLFARNQEKDGHVGAEDRVVNGTDMAEHPRKLCQPLKNPVVVLSEIPNISFYKKVSPCTVNGMSESPKKSRRYSELPSPAFPRTVIDDLVACPQRLTRGRTQLMLGDGEKRPRKASKRRKSMFELGKGRDVVLEIVPQDSESPIIQQRLTRRRLRWLGSKGLAANDMDVIDELSCSPLDFDIDTGSKAPASSPSKDANSGQASKRIHVDDLTGSPSRLTRARVRSLGLDQGIEN